MPGKEFGFSLLEIMVALGILAIVTAVTVPNLRRYSEDQMLNNQVTELVRVFRQAQSSAQTNTQCPSTKTAVNWIVEITDTEYTLNATCKERFNFVPTPLPSGSIPTPTPTPNLETRPVAEFTGKIKLLDSDCPDTNPKVKITFMGNDAKFSCLSTTTPITETQFTSFRNFCLALENDNNSEVKFVSVTRGGTINEDLSESCKTRLDL